MYRSLSAKPRGSGPRCTESVSNIEHSCSCSISDSESLLLHFRQPTRDVLITCHCRTLHWALIVTSDRLYMKGKPAISYTGWLRAYATPSSLPDRRYMQVEAEMERRSAWHTYTKPMGLETMSLLICLPFFGGIGVIGPA